jgi:hypothetical protein
VRFDKVRTSFLEKQGLESSLDEVLVGGERFLNPPIFHEATPQPDPSRDREGAGAGKTAC